MAKNIVNQIRKATRGKFSVEEKSRIVMEGLLGEIPISELAPPGRHRPHGLLSLVQRLPGSRQEAAIR